MAILKGLALRLARTPEENRAENLHLWASAVAGAGPISDVHARERCRIAGVIRNVRIDPRVGHGSVEATVIDGTGELIARFLGRSSLSGIRIGAGMLIEGMVAKSSAGELMVLNPEYQLMPGPEQQ